MGVLVACKNDEDPIKNEGARVVTTLIIDFRDAQGQLTQKSVKESCRNSNPSKLLWLTLLPTRMKKIHSKLKAQERSQHFSHYKSIWKKTKNLWVSLLPARMKKIQSKMKALEWSQH